MTCLPSSSASWRRSAAWSRTSAIVSSRSVRPSGSTIGSAASSCGEAIVPVVRTLCSSPPTRASPPGILRLDAPQLTRHVARRRAERRHAIGIEIDADLARHAADAAARCRRPSPHVSSRITVRSTNHDSSVSLMFGDSTLKVTTGLPAVVTREMTGSRASAGRSARMRGHRVAHVVDGFADVALEAGTRSRSSRRLR